MEDKVRMEVDRRPGGEVYFKLPYLCRIIPYRPSLYEMLKAERLFLDPIGNMPEVRQVVLIDPQTLYVTLKPGYNEGDLLSVPSKIVEMINETSGIEFTARL